MNMVNNKSDKIKKPNFCVIEVSHRCMLKCKMCYDWKNKGDPAEVTIKELFKFISSLKDFVDGPFEINIAGGEPLLKEGIFDLIEFIANQGFSFSMTTNAYLLDKGVARRIADSGLSFIPISLDSLDEDIHDYLRGVRGVHKRAMEALGYFIDYPGKLKNLTIQTIIMGPNLDGILDLVNWVQEKQIAVSFMAIMRPNMVPIDPRWYEKKEFTFLWPKNISKVCFVIDELIKLKQRGYKIDNPIGQLERFKLYFANPQRFVRETYCSLGDDILHINYRGDIHLCCEMDPIGNIKKENINKVWISEKAGNIREKIRLCRRNCAEMVNCYREE